MPGGERRPLHLQAGVDGCGMSHCPFLYGGDDHSEITDQHSPPLKAYYTLVMKQDHRQALAMIYNISFFGDFSLKIVTYKSIPLGGNR